MKVDGGVAAELWRVVARAIEGAGKAPRRHQEKSAVIWDRDANLGYA
jgi:hypothetical protein